MGDDRLLNVTATATVRPHRHHSWIRRRACSITDGGYQDSHEMPPKAARTKGPPKGGDAPMHQSREAHHPARPLHSPEGPHAGRRFRTRHQRWHSRQPIGTEGLPQSKHGQTLKALTCRFAPLAGLEPATYGEVRQHPSA
jgi:hypothetical protein